MPQQMLLLMFPSLLSLLSQESQRRGTGSGRRNNATGSSAGRWSCITEVIRGGGLWNLAVLHHPVLKSWTSPRRIHLPETSRNIRKWWLAVVQREGQQREDSTLQQVKMREGAGDRWCFLSRENIGGTGQVARGARVEGWAEHRGLDENVGTDWRRWSSQGCHWGDFHQRWVNRTIPGVSHRVVYA